MQISGYGAISQSAWPTEQKRRTAYNHENQVSRGDTATFSDEAMALLAKMQQAKAEAAEKQAEAALTKSEDEKAEQESNKESGKTSATANGVKQVAVNNTESQSGFGDTAGEHSEQKAEDSSVHGKNKAAETDSAESIDVQIEKLKGKIKELAKTMNKILSDESMPIETREQMVKPIEEKINQLYAQIAQLEAKKAAMAQQETKQQ